jgi:glycosyltransferase involved in cell wall biosynthesis
MNTIRLSYILTTYNKLPYLSVTLPLLISQKKPDEEIVVVDGGSGDGTPAYLRQLFDEKKIDQFISEKDFGEAHGTNKAMLMAKGELIKIITDDDVYHYPALQVCKTFMLGNPQIDLLGCGGLSFNINQSTYSYNEIDYTRDFNTWKQTRKPFLLCGLSFMMRRSSLAYMGLFDAKYTIVDIEYAVRVSSMKTNIAYYTGIGYVNIVNPQSNSHKFYETIAREKKQLAKTYPLFRNKITYRGSVIKLKEMVSKAILKKPKTSQAQYDYKKIVEESIHKLNDVNNQQAFTFLS